MNETIENNPSADSQVAGATTGEQSQTATGNSEATSELKIPEKFKSQEDFIKAYNELETYQIELGAKAHKGERYEKVVDLLVQTTGQSRWEVEAQLDQQLSNPTIVPAQQVQTSGSDRKVLELERKMEWGEVVGKSPELSDFKDTILDFANAKNISVAEAVKTLKPIFDSGKEAAKTKETEKSEVRVPTSTGSVETPSVDKEIQDQQIRIEQIKSGKIEGDLNAEGFKLVALMEKKRKGL